MLPAPSYSSGLIEQALRATAGFAEWPAESMSTLVNKSRLVRHRRGAVVGHEDASTPETLAVVTGQLMAELALSDGSVFAFGLVNTGSVVGLSQALSHDSRPGFRYRAHDEATVIHLPSEFLLGVLDATPALWKDMARMLLRQKRDMQSSVLAQTTGPLPVRLAATLDRLATMFGQTVGNATVIRLRISQDELAQLLHVTRPTVTKALKVLQQDGLIRVKYSSLIVLDLERLRRMTT